MTARRFAGLLVSTLLASSTVAWAENIVEGPDAPVPQHLVEVMAKMRALAKTQCEQQNDCKNLNNTKQLDDRLRSLYEFCKAGQHEDNLQACDNYEQLIASIDTLVEKSNYKGNSGNTGQQ